MSNEVILGSFSLIFITILLIVGLFVNILDNKEPEKNNENIKNTSNNDILISDLNLFLDSELKSSEISIIIKTKSLLFTSKSIVYHFLFNIDGINVELKEIHFFLNNIKISEEYIKKIEQKISNSILEYNNKKEFYINCTISELENNFKINNLFFGDDFYSYKSVTDLTVNIKRGYISFFDNELIFITDINVYNKIFDLINKKFNEYTFNIINEILNNDKLEKENNFEYNYSYKDECILQINIFKKDSVILKYKTSNNIRSIDINISPKLYNKLLDKFCIICE